MPRTVRLSSGVVRPHCVLCVHNVTGVAEERGFRLCWVQPDDQRYLTPALGLVTSNPFRTAGAAVAYGKRHFREDEVFLVTRAGLRRLA